MREKQPNEEQEEQVTESNCGCANQPAPAMASPLLLKIFWTCLRHAPNLPLADARHDLSLHSGTCVSEFQPCSCFTIWTFH